MAKKSAWTLKRDALRARLEKLREQYVREKLAIQEELERHIASCEHRKVVHTWSLEDDYHHCAQCGKHLRTW